MELEEAISGQVISSFTSSQPAGRGFSRPNGGADHVERWRWRRRRRWGWRRRWWPAIVVAAVIVVVAAVIVVVVVVAVVVVVWLQGLCRGWFSWGWL